MAGLSPQGFTIKRLSEIIESRIADTKNYFGESANTTTDSVLGRTLRIDAASEADLWELAELIYTSFNPDFAQGVALDRLVLLSGLERQQATKSSVELLVEGAKGTIIPKGSLVSSQVTGNRWETEDDVTINTAGLSSAVLEVFTAQAGIEYSVTLNSDSYSYTAVTGDTETSIATEIAALVEASTQYVARTRNDVQIEIESNSVYSFLNVSTSSNIAFVSGKKIVEGSHEEIGPVEQPAQTIRTILVPVTGWLSVTNPEEASAGSYRESDDDLRIRFKQSKENKSSSSLNAIYSRITGIEGVRNVQVYENTADVTDALGIPPHKFLCIVEGGTETEIASVVFDTKPAGIGSYGNVDVDLVDSQGVTQTVSFSRPTEVPIYLTLTISSLEGSAVPSSAAEEIKEAVANYFVDKFTVGSDVVYSRLYTPINSVSGFQVDAMYIDTAANPTTTANIAIPFDSIATITKDDIVINQV